MGIESQYIWMDGEMLPFEQANVHILSHTLHYGLGAFEGIRAYRQKDGSGGIFKLDEHLERLFDSAKMCRMKMPFEFETVRQACIDTLRANNFKEHTFAPLSTLDTEPWDWAHGTIPSDWPLPPGNGAHIWGKKVSQKVFLWAQVRILAIMSMPTYSGQRSSAIMSTLSWPGTKLMKMDTKKPSCLIILDMWPKEQAKTCLSFGKAESKHLPL